MSVALFPAEVIIESKRVYVSVEYCGKLTYGQCVVDWNNFTKEDPNVKLILKLNGQCVIDEITKLSQR